MKVILHTRYGPPDLLQFKEVDRPAALHKLNNLRYPSPPSVHWDEGALRSFRNLGVLRRKRTERGILGIAES